MDLVWLFFILCPYMLVYFYFCDFTGWANWKIAIFWTIGLLIIVLIWFVFNYFYGNRGPFPAPFL